MERRNFLVGAAAVTAVALTAGRSDAAEREYLENAQRLAAQADCEEEMLSCT